MPINTFHVNYVRFALVITFGLVLLASAVEEETEESREFSLSLQVHRTELLPYEPLLATLVATNESTNRSFFTRLNRFHVEGGYLWFRKNGAEKDWERLFRWRFTYGGYVPGHKIAPGQSYVATAGILAVSRSWRRMTDVHRGSEPKDSAAAEKYLAPRFSPGLWEIRARHGIFIDDKEQDRTEKRKWGNKNIGMTFSNKVTLHVKAPRETNLAVPTEGNPDANDSELAPYRDLVATGANPFNTLPSFLCRGEHSEYYLTKTKYREELRSFVNKHPRSRYSLYLRHTYLASRGDSEKEEEKAMCDEYRRFLRKHAKNFFPEHMRDVYMPRDTEEELNR